MTLEYDLLSFYMAVKEMALQVSSLQEENPKAMSENQSLRLSEQEVITLALSSLCPKRYIKTTKKISEPIQTISCISITEGTQF